MTTTEKLLLIIFCVSAYQAIVTTIGILFFHTVFLEIRNHSYMIKVILGAKK